MEPLAAGAVRWSCARCGVSTGKMDGTQMALPPTWTRVEEGIFCLGCSRALAGDAAIDDAPGNTPRGDLVRIRRKALIEFEIHRVPDAPNRTIANACNTSTATVAAIRGAPGPPFAAERDGPRRGDG